LASKQDRLMHQLESINFFVMTDCSVHDTIL
jgi:hypothetical protein